MFPGWPLIKRFVFLAILIFSFASSLFCQAKSLSEIDALIKQTDYDQALDALSAFIKNNPESLDSAQRRIDAIMRARSYYTRLANDLLDVMEKEPENAEKKLAIIKELESLEKNPTQEHLAFIRQAKSAAEFTYYRAQFRRLMEDSARLTRAQKYSDSLSTLQSGFYMYRDEFYEENPVSVTEPASQTARGIERACSDYLALRSALLDAYKNFMQALEAANYFAAERSWQAFRAQMQSFASVRNKIVEAGDSLEATFNSLKKSKPELTEASYLSFMNRFAMGISSVEDSGVLGAMDFEWNYLLGNCKDAARKAVLKKFDEGLSPSPLQKALENPFSPDYARLNEADLFASLALGLNDLDSIKARKGGGFEQGAPLYASSMDAAKSFGANTKGSVDNLNDFKALLSDFDSKIEPKEILQNARSSNSFTLEILSSIRALESCEKKAQDALSQKWYVDYNDSLKGYFSDKGDGGLKKDAPLEFKKANDFYQGINSLCLSEANARISAAWKKLDSYSQSLASLVYDNYRDIYKDAQSLLENHYPDQAVQKVLSLQKEISSDKNLLLAQRESLSKSSSKESFSQIDKSVLALDQWQSEGSSILASARQEILLSQSAQSQADEVFRRAQGYYQAENFSGARNSLQRARELYNESLAHQESQALRAESDKNLADLGQRINDAENKIVVTEVRALKTRAKNEYYAGNFESAESALNRAESRWAVTNIEEDEEIKNLKLLVQNALSMKTGREIKPTAPLYPEMSQILSNARQYFDQGAKLIKDGKKEEAVSILNEAKKKLQELQLVYPLNQEAALLTLRIDELLDPKQFNESFSRRVSSARQSARVPATQQQGYSDLLDLAQIRPDYPGLKKLIYDVEIEIGVRQKPVDQSALRRSASIEKEAERLYNNARGNEEILRQALSRLDQAIALNPNNESAITLKDRIQIAVGGKAAVVLSSADEASYNRAIQELRANNVVGAYTIVEQLLQKSENRRSSKILDLQKQVQARM